MCTEYWFDVLLTIPDFLVGELPETPEPIVKFFTHDYINNYRFRPTDPIISEQQMKTYLEDNGINLERCTIMQRPKSNTYEAIINGYQLYRVHWIVECEFDEEKCYVKIPKKAREFIDEVHRITHENSFTKMEIAHSNMSWEDSWIHKHISYAEFRAQALCNEADSLLDSVDRTIKESLDRNINDVRQSLQKQSDSLRDSLFRQHGALLQDVRAFEDRVKKTLSKPNEIINYESVIEELTKKNTELMETIKNDKTHIMILFFGQLFVIAMLRVHVFSFR